MDASLPEKWRNEPARVGAGAVTLGEGSSFCISTSGGDIDAGPWCSQTSPSLWGSMLAEGSTPSSASGWTGPSPGSEPEPAAVFREDRSGSVTSVVVGA
jgi:hypothetical protein